jgi:hypothetical protein
MRIPATANLTHIRGKKGVKIHLKHQVFKPKRGKFAILSGGGACFWRTRFPSRDAGTALYPANKKSPKTQYGR